MTTHTIDTTPGIELAREWIQTDPYACRDDVGRLGLSGVATYSASLARDSVDTAWHALTAAALRAALRELLTEDA